MVFKKLINLSCPLETYIQGQRQTKECLHSSMSCCCRMTCPQINSPHPIFPTWPLTQTHIGLIATQGLGGRVHLSTDEISSISSASH